MNEPGTSGLSKTPTSKNIKPLSENRPDIDDHLHNDPDKEAIENETKDLLQKMKQPGYNSRYYGSIDILSASTKVNIINPVN